MSKNNDSKDQKKSENYTHNNDLCKGLAYLNYITEKLEKRERVPLYVFNRFIEILNREFAVEELIKKVNEEAVQNTIVRFSNRYYEFSCSRFEEDLPDFSKDPFKLQSIKVEYNLKGLIEHVFLEITYEMERQWTATDCVQHVYSHVEKYINNNLNITTKEFLKPYKRATMATFISMQLGYTFTNRHPKDGIYFNNQELFDISKNSLKNIMKK